MKDILDRAAQTRLVVFDVDGVLTDGSLYLGDHGEEYKAFYSRDGHGMKMLMESGVEIAIITGRTSNVVAHRMQSLGIRHVYQGRLNKVPAFEELYTGLKLAPEQIAYMGDDVMDLPVMRRVGLAVAVQDAHPLVRQHAHWSTTAPGGRGAARELCELIMDAQGTLAPRLAEYLLP